MITWPPVAKKWFFLAVQYVLIQILERFVHSLSITISFYWMTPIRPSDGISSLPENLQKQFRPVSLIQADPSMIAEVLLIGQGFTNHKQLAHKLSHIYRIIGGLQEPGNTQIAPMLCMRRMKHVILLAGSYKQASPKQDETALIVKAARDVLLPNFPQSEMSTFTKMMDILFPMQVENTTAVPTDEPEQKLRELLRIAQKEAGFQQVEAQVEKAVQLYKAMLLYHSIVVVGESRFIFVYALPKNYSTGKSSTLRLLAQVLPRFTSQHENCDLQCKRVRLIPLDMASLMSYDSLGQAATTSEQVRYFSKLIL